MVVFEASSTTTFPVPSSEHVPDMAKDAWLAILTYAPEAGVEILIKGLTVSKIKVRDEFA